MKRLLTVALTVIVALTMTLGTSVCAYGASSKDALELEATTAILIDVLLISFEKSFSALIILFISLDIRLYNSLPS